MAPTHTTVKMICAAKLASVISNYVLTSFNRSLRTMTDKRFGTQTDNVEPQRNKIANIMIQGRGRLGIWTLECQSVCERNSGRLIDKGMHYH